MAADTQRAATREEQKSVGGALRHLIKYGLPLTDAQVDLLIIAIAKRVREAEERGRQTGDRDAAEAYSEVDEHGY